MIGESRLAVRAAIAVAAVFILTSLVGMCPLYSIIGLKTCRDC